MTSKDLEVFNEMPFFFWVKDDEGTYLWVKKALREMAGDEVVGYCKIKIKSSTREGFNES